MCWFGMDTAVSILNQRPLSPVTLTPALTGSDISSPWHHLEENAHMSLSQQQSHISYQQGLLLMALQAGTRSQRGWEAFWAAWSPANLHQPQELPRRCSSGPNTQKTHESFSRSCVCAKCLEKKPKKSGQVDALADTTHRVKSSQLAGSSGGPKAASTAGLAGQEGFSVFQSQAGVILP